MVNSVQLLLLWIVVIASVGFSNTLVLDSGDHLECPDFRERLTVSCHFFFCGDDTVQPHQIRGMIDGTGYHPYVAGVFLHKKIAGKLSLYTGELRTVRYEEVGGMKTINILQERKRRVTFYSFNDSLFQPFRYVGKNELLATELKCNRDAYKWYRSYKLLQGTGGVLMGATIFELVCGLGSLNFGDKASTISHFTACASFLAVNITLQGVAAPHLLKKAITTYNQSET